MKRLSFIWVLEAFTIAFFVISGCSKNEPAKPNGSDNTLSVSISSLSANSKGIKTTFSITASSGWTISGGDGWCTVSPTSGSGNATINIEILENPTTNDRSSKITITSGQLRKDIEISQSEMSAILLTGKSTNIECVGGKILVELKSNVSFDIIIPADAGWITHLNTKTLNTNTVEFNIANNTAYSPRTGKVIFKEKSGNLADTLTVNQGEYYYVHCPLIKVYRQKVESVLSVKIQASVETDFNIIEGSSWITMTNYDVAKSTYTFRFSTNPSEENRFGKVRFFRKGGSSVADTMEIKQSGFDGYYLYLVKGIRLESAISSNLRPQISRLKIEGELDESDFSCIRTNFRHLDVIDISESTLQDNALPDVAFAGDETLHMSMHKIVLPVNLESVGYAAFSNCTNLGTINLPNGIKTISNAAFIACSGITGTLTLPTSLETIGNYAFSQCSSLESVTLPKTLKSIGFGAFHSCNLQFVNALMENPFPLINSFNNDGRKTLVVPKGKKEVYNSTSGWNNTNIFKKIVEMGESFEDYIRCDKKSLICYNEVNTASFKIESSSEWKIDSKPSWVTISKSTGNNGETINVSLSALSGVNFREGKIAVSLLTGAASTEITVYQHSLPFSDGSWIKLQGATIGSGVDLVFMGDGYTAADIFAGKYTADINNAISHFFDIEPYRSYRGYFNVYLVYGFSQESGISDLDNRVNTLFKTKFNDKTGTGMSADVDICKIYALKAPLRDISSTTVILIANSTRYAGTCIMFSYGFSVAICPAIQGIYPYDFRGLVQHEACGHGFGQLADEYVKYTGTIPALEVSNLRSLQSYGMFLNVDATNDRSVVLWRHFFNDPVYTYVGTFEGGLYYPQGIWRPESGSLMINNIRYINAPSREIIVKRIKRLAGEQFSFTEFRAKDRNELSAATKAGILMIDPTKFLAPPIIIKVP